MQLPDDLTVDLVQLRDDLGAALQTSAPLVLDARAVRRVSTSALTLLLAATRDARERGLAVSWVSVPEVLREPARHLGLAEALQLPAA